MPSFALSLALALIAGHALALPMYPAYVPNGERCAVTREARVVSGALNPALALCASAVRPECHGAVAEWR